MGENDDGNNYNFYGAQVMVTLETSLGEGHYRVKYNFTSKAFLDQDGTSEEQRDVLIYSFDQELGDFFGAWIRFAFGSDKALVDYKSLYSGGINVSSRWWGREQDTIGIGFGYLDGPEQTEESIKYTRLAEGYVRFGLNDYLSLTFDLQYMQDKYVDTASDNDADGWIAGVRMTAEF